MKIAIKRKVTFKFKLILLTCFLVYTGIAIYTQQVNIADLSAGKQELTQQYAQAQEDLSRLEHQYEYMNTEDYIENTAREKLGLAYDGEIILEPKS
jgi:cell division protein DivIC